MNYGGRLYGYEGLLRHDRTSHIIERYVEVTSDFTLLDSHHATHFICNSTGAIKITIPTNSTHPIGKKFYCQVTNSGTGPVYFEKQRSAIAISTVYLGVAASGGNATLEKYDTNSWILSGAGLVAALDVDAYNYINAVGTFTVAQKNGYNDFVVTGKDEGWYALLYALYPNFGGTTANVKWNAINPLDTDAAFRKAFTGSPTVDQYGISYNGTTQYGDTKCVPATHMINNDTGMTFYSLTTGQRAGLDMGCGAGSAQMIMHGRDTSNVMYGDEYAFARRAQASGITDGSGIYTTTRVSATVHKLYKGTAQVGATDTGTSSLFTSLTTPIFTGGINFNGAPNSLSAVKEAMSAIHKGMNDTKISQFHAALATLQALK